MDEHPKLRLREQLRTVIRTLRYSRRTEQAYWHWIRNYMRFHQLRHPLEMAEQEVREYLTWLAIHRNVAGATQNQALNALVFFYGKVLCRPLGEIEPAMRARRSPRLPVVLCHQEAMAVIHSDVRTTQIYTHVLGQRFAGTRSPPDR